MRVLLLLGANVESWTFLQEFTRVDAEAFAILGPAQRDTVAAIAPDLIVSYNHRHIVTPDVLAIPRLGAVNLHPSYLPYNRGAHPLFWAVAEGTPLGVTVHRMDAGLDTGAILGQELVEMRSNEMCKPGDTLNSLHERAHLRLRGLFWLLWPAIIAGVPGTPQEGEGTFHRISDLTPVARCLPAGWHTPVSAVRRHFHEAVVAA